MCPKCTTDAPDATHIRARIEANLRNLAALALVVRTYRAHNDALATRQKAAPSSSRWHVTAPIARP